MVGVLKNQWSLLRLAAGFTRPETPLGWVSHALRAVSFVVVLAFLTWPFVGLFNWWIYFSLGADILRLTTWVYIYLCVSIAISVAISLWLLPRLLTIPAQKTKNQILVTSAKGITLTLALTFGLVTLLLLSLVSISVNDVRVLPDLSTVATPLYWVGLISIGFRVWLLKPNRYKVPVWLLNMFIVALLVPALMIFVYTEIAADLRSYIPSDGFG